MDNELIFSLLEKDEYEDDLFDRESPIVMLKEKLEALLVYRATGFLSSYIEKTVYKDGCAFFDKVADTDFYEEYDMRYFINEGSLYSELFKKMTEIFKGTTIEECAIYDDDLATGYYEDMDDFENYFKGTPNYLKNIGLTIADELFELDELVELVKDELWDNPTGEFGSLYLFILRSEELGKLLSGANDSSMLHQCIKGMQGFESRVINGVFYAYRTYGVSYNGYFETPNPFVLSVSDVARMLVIKKCMDEQLLEVNETTKEEEVHYELAA